MDRQCVGWTATERQCAGWTATERQCVGWTARERQCVGWTAREWSGGLPQRDSVPGGLPQRDSVPGGLPVRDSVSGGLHDYVPTKDSSESCCRSTDASYTCDHCEKHYESRSGLFKHTRSSHPQVDQTNQQIYCKESLCDYACSRVYQLRTHLTETHGLEMRPYSKVFSSNEGIYICQCSCMCTQYYTCNPSPYM